MIYVLLINGASVVPLFVPGIPQLFLLLVMFHGIGIRVPKPSSPILITIIVFISLIFCSILTSDELTGIFYTKMVANCIVGAGLAMVAYKKYGQTFGYAYTKAIALFIILGILGSFITLLSTWNVATSIGERTYHTNLLTSWISDAGQNSSATLFSPFPYRLQSMFDEPGTFGILLIPALFFSLEKRIIPFSMIILIGIFLSESFNAWLLCIVILIRSVILSKNILLQLIAVSLLVASLYQFFPILVELYEIKAGISEAYKNVSSLGVRQKEFSFFIAEGMNYLAPNQAANLKNIFPNGISVSYLRWYFNTGVFFIVMFTPLVFFFTYHFFSKRNHCAEDSFPFVLAATILLSGFQRSSYLDHIIFLTLIFWCLIYLGNRKIHMLSKN